jgi:putative NADH-flavin reductase
MRIAVYGALGTVGKRVVAEALGRGHQVTAVLRDPARSGELPDGVEFRAGDAIDAAGVAELSAGQDLVITATRPAAGREGELLAVTESLLAGLAGTGVRLLLVGGAGSLRVPGAGGRTVIDDPAHLPPAARPIALACGEQLAAVRADRAVDWTYLSPAAQLQPGERTGGYRQGTDELLVDAEGRSSISMEDLAVALLDEAERPRHRRGRFTVGY